MVAVVNKQKQRQKLFNQSICCSVHVTIIQDFQKLDDNASLNERDIKAARVKSTQLFGQVKTAKEAKEDCDLPKPLFPPTRNERPPCVIEDEHSKKQQRAYTIKTGMV
jgi:hypothetical protein